MLEGLRVALSHPKKNSKTEKYVKNKKAYSKLSRGTRQTLEKLWEYEVPVEIIKRLNKNFPFNMMSHQKTLTCIDEFKKFMAIMVIGHEKKRGVAMTSPVIDEIWHQLILFTMEYHRFSEIMNKKFIHHTPNTKSFSFGPDAVKFFYDTYKEYFGELNPIWTYTILEEKRGNLQQVKSDYCSPPVLASRQDQQEINYGDLVYEVKYRVGKKSLKKSAISDKATGYAKGENKEQSGSCGGAFACGVYTSGYTASDSGIVTEGDAFGVGSDGGDGGDGGGCGGCGGCG